jgi:hypothetical protein
MLAPGQPVDHIPTSPPSDSRTTHSPDIGEFLDVPNRDTSSVEYHEFPATTKIQTKLQGPLKAFRIRYLMKGLKTTRKARAAKHLSSKTGGKD